MNFGIGIWLLFTVGVLLHALKLADDAVRIDKKFGRIRDFLGFYRVPLIIRSVLEGAIFWAWKSHPDLLDKGLAAIGLPASASLNLPVMFGTALLFGYFIDSVLDFGLSRVPWLQKQIPSITPVTTLFLQAVMISGLMLGSAGCGAKHVYVAHPNSINRFDSETFDVLYDAQNTIEEAKAQLQKGQLPPEASPVVDAARKIYNQAEVDYQTWHHAFELSQGDAAALAKLQGDLGDLKKSIGGLKNLLGGTK